MLKCQEVPGSVSATPISYRDGMLEFQREMGVPASEGEDVCTARR